MAMFAEEDFRLHIKRILVNCSTDNAEWMCLERIDDYIPKELS